MGHRHVGDVRAPDLVGTDHRKVSQEVGIFTMPVIGDARSGLAVDRLNTHFTAETLKPFAVHCQSVFSL